MTQVLAGLSLVVAALLVVALTGGSSTPAAGAPSFAGRNTPLPPRSAYGHVLGSMLQDDPHLVFASTPTVARTLDILKTLGVNQIRATVVWKDIAPDPFSSTAPRFNATDPAAYSAIGWGRYDRLDALAHARGMTLNLNVTAPAPLWAVARGTPSAHYADHWMPSAGDFGRFVQALGTRYSGHYVPSGGHTALPRVRFWSIWNEANQPGWLAPQWRSTADGPVMVAPALYRAYADAAFAALVHSGHRPSGDTILVGDLAPEGCVAGVRCIYPRPEWPIPPLPFLRALYCLSPGYRPLSGTAATALGCPAVSDRRTFVSAHPALFEATGFAHHPYSFFAAPNVSLPDPAFAPLSNLSRLERALDSVFQAYGVPRRLPIYLTEYGYETNPPNPYRGVSPQLQADYLQQAEYMAWSDPRVRTLNQFLLYDFPPNRSFPKGSPGYWSTFQTGLMYANGVSKPSLAAYRLPVFLPRPVLSRDHRVFVWAMLRDAPPGSTQQAEIQWRPASPGGAYRTLRVVTVTGPSEVLTATVTVPGPGEIRIRWRSPSGGVQDSLAASVRTG